MAVTWKGALRFGWVNRLENELLAESFNVRQLPQVFLLKAGTAYWYRDFPTETTLSRYIAEEAYFRSSTKFAQPKRFFGIQLYLYSYPRNEIRYLYATFL